MPGWRDGECPNVPQHISIPKPTLLDWQSLLFVPFCALKTFPIVFQILKLLAGSQLSFLYLFLFVVSMDNFKSFFIALVFRILIVMCSGGFFVFSILNEELQSVGFHFYHIWKVFCHYFSKYLSCPPFLKFYYLTLGYQLHICWTLWYFPKSYWCSVNFLLLFSHVTFLEILYCYVFKITDVFPCKI